MSTKSYPLSEKTILFAVILPNVLKMTSKDLYYLAFNFLRLSKHNTEGEMTKTTEIFSIILKARSPGQRYQLYWFFDGFFP